VSNNTYIPNLLNITHNLLNLSNNLNPSTQPGTPEVTINFKP
jgi:hypothetical protein